MVGWKIFSRKGTSTQKVTTGRFEVERDGQVAYLEYTLTGSVLGLLHTGFLKTAWSASCVHFGGDCAQYP
jgi:hypothetical protein